MDSADKLSDLSVDELRSCFIKGPVSLDIEQKLLASRRLRRALLGTPISNQVRWVLVNGEMSNCLRSELISEMNSTVPVVKSRRASSSGGIASPIRAVDNNDVLVSNRCSTPLDAQASSTTVSSDSALQVVHQILSSWEQQIHIGTPTISEACEKLLKRKRDNSPSGPSRTDIVCNNPSAISSSSSPRDRTDPTGSEPQRFDAGPAHQLPSQLVGEKNADDNYPVDSHYGLDEDRKEDRDCPENDESNYGVRLMKRKTSEVSSTTPAAREIKWDYNTWTDSSGNTRSTAGALLPQGYTLHDDLQFPWICPVRSCRATFATLTGLGSHFSVVHRASLLNDNEDGTLSVVKKIARRIPASVVSKKPLDPEEPPMAKPFLTFASRCKVSKGAALASPQTSPVEPISKRTHNQAASSPMMDLSTTGASLGGKGTRLWKYIQSKLVHTPLSPIPRRGHVPQLLQHLSRVRNVEFNPHARIPFKEARDQDISAMIIQVAGKRANVPCSSCKMGKGPFRGCYVIPTSAPLSLRQSILGCANCFYKCNQTYCDIKMWSLETYPELGGIRTPEGTVTPPPACITADEKQPERRSERIILKKSLAASMRTRNSPRRSSRSSRMKSAPNIANIPSSATANTISPSQMLELETWEIAPGRIRGDEQDDTIYNYAFSNAYLTQNQVVRIGRDISFQVVPIKPGAIYDWEASNDKVRLCSIASGKLQFKMHGQEFSMGPNGMVRIKPGAGCTVMNKLYVDAMVHVATVPGDLC